MTLFSSGPAIHQLGDPTPKLTILSIDMRSALDAAVLTPISRTFSDTLERLRILRNLHGPYMHTRQSPARVCGALYVRS